MDNLKTILIIDDSDFNINTLIEILDDRYDILASLDGRDGLELLEEERVDLILLDIVMPDMDGFEVCKTVKADSRTADIPVIFITSNSDEESIERAYDVGGVDYITKPFRAREVLSRIETHLSLSEQKNILQHDLQENLTLLSQYKDVVDKSTIVSKTDKDGKITYVNNAFCQISGYRLNELIGKDHDIIRDPEASESVIKELWDTLKERKTWQGELQNRKKDGETFYVQSTIMPIVDSDGDTVEYIGVSHDVTDIYKLQKEIVDTQREVVFTMGAIGETRSKETGHHVKRVAEYSRLLAYYVGLSGERVDLIAEASPMHDIGKVAINDNILHKPGKLTDEEFTIMRTHAELGYKMLAHSDRPLLKVAATIALEHHERWDGKGYPNGLREESISIEGRITAIADVFDALGSERVYKKAWKDDDIFRYFREQQGKQFDPKLIDLFFENLEQFLEIRDKFVDV
jgi:PAS domain S-box-containing protein